MEKRIPEEIIEEVRKSADIVDVISEHVQLKKQGKNFSGLCPFHGEKTPSFSVSPDKQLYHCFGCGTGGNVFSFLMELEGLSFMETVQRLAERNNITLPETVSKAEDSSKDERLTPFYEAHSLAAKYYHYVLVETDEGKPAREYLRKRGFTQAAIDQFQVGFAPDSWDFLAPFLEKRGFLMEDMEACGLVGRRESDGKAYDRFRDRVMFPIHHTQGKVIAFGGRGLGDARPKYLNSHESVIFNKSVTLYGFFQARPKMKKRNEAVLFEGYVDVIAAWRAGIDNGIASLGTAMTEQQAKMIRRNVDRVLLCYDGDGAGQQATYKNARILMDAGLTVTVANLPSGYDPDDYIQEFGKERFAADVIGNRKSWMQFLFDYFVIDKDLSLETDRVAYIESILTETSIIENPVERDMYVQKLAERFNLSQNVLREELSRIRSSQRKKEHREIRQSIINQTDRSAKKMMTAEENAERELIAHMMRSSDISRMVEDEIGAAFQFEMYQAIAAHLYSYYSEGYEPAPGMFLERIEDPDIRSTASELAMKQIEEDVSDQVLKDYIHSVRNAVKRQKLHQLQKKQQEAIEQRDHLVAAELGMEVNRLHRELKYRNE